MTMTFQDFGLSEALNTSLHTMDYKDPTPIQQQAIPIALSGKDVLGSAQTGTGKTAAFSIPLVEKLLQSDNNNCALVLTPTRELAKQVLDVIHQLLGPKSSINTAFIIGGEPYRKQFEQLAHNPRIIVGTPGRINDHLDKGKINLNRTNFLVLDETDRMLDMGFGVQLDRIVKHLPKQRQTLMFSATLPNGIIKIADKYLKNPQRISVGETNVVATNIKQETIHIEQSDKYQELQIQLNERQGSVIVFVKTKHNADKMAKKLREGGFTSEGLHGDLRQTKRDKVMKNFRDKNFRILVATDIAARGLDVPHIEHVINYDLPQVAEDYIHRMGRTARAGATGSAISFISPSEGRKWHAIEMLLDPEAAMHKHSEPVRRNKSRKKPYRGRPEKPEDKSNAHKNSETDNNAAPKPARKGENDNKQKRSKNSREKYIAKADRTDGAQSQNKPKKKFKTKRDIKFADPVAEQFIKDRKPKKKKSSANKNKNTGKSTFNNGNKPVRRKAKKKKAP